MSLARALTLALTVLAATPAGADEPRFGADDVPTVFFINKSDDHNRVDYGMRLDGACHPVGRAAVFPYWREFEHAPPVRTHGLGLFEHVAYGISATRVLRTDATGGEYLVRLKRIDRDIVIRTARATDGRCEAIARTTISGASDAVLHSAFVQLAGPMSVDWVEIHGARADVGTPLAERIRH